MGRNKLNFNVLSTSGGSSQNRIAIMLAIGGVLIIVAKLFFSPYLLNRFPEWIILPYAEWLQVTFDFIRNDLGLLTLTRTISSGLEAILDFTGNLLYGKNRFPYFEPIPWIAISAVAAILGYWLSGWKLSVLSGGTFVWIALIGQWKLAMQTLSVIAVAAPVAMLVGLLLGIIAWKYARFDRFIKPFLSVLQTLPFFTYLLPAVIFFKVGPTAGCVATIIFAIPPMVIMTTLGLNKVPHEIVEAGHMSGTTRWQMLRYVQLPAARTEILVGVNQVIMLSLAMVVLTAFIGMPGLGAKLLSLMSSLKLGRSIEIGITIVLVAITLDRCSKAWIKKQPEHFEKGTAWATRHRFILMSVAVIIISYILAYFFPILSIIPNANSLSVSKPLDAGIDAVLGNDLVTNITGWLRAVLITKVLIPFREALLWIPTPAFLLGLASLGYVIGGRKSAFICAGFFAIIALTGWWDRAIISLYAVVAAVSLACLIGIPLGIYAARHQRLAEPILLACDTAQTFPSFIYLIPAIMLFGVNDVAVIFSILIFATVPLTRYTIEGLRSVPHELVEAADMSGATAHQKLLNVQLPLALPTMAVGFNQAIMFAFFMVIIAAFIGTQDLGQELQKTLAGGQLGKNIVLGMCVSLMALTFDHLVMRWSRDRKRALGLEQ